MGRNYKKNKNITVPLDRDGEALRDLIKAATESGMSHQIGVYAGQCLAAYFKALRESRIMPEGMTFYAIAAPSGAMQGPMWGPMAAPRPAPGAPSGYHQNGNGNGSSGPSAAELERLADRPEVIDLNTGDGDDLSYFFDQEETEEEE